jgi:uroporphyrinogen-III synthase
MRTQPGSSLAKWYVISLRPRGQHDALRRAAAARGARLVALSPQRIELREDRATRAALRDALAAPVVVFTSPNAVRAARALRQLKRRRTQQVFAVGEGTARALRRAGIDEVHAPQRMDSEGLLGLPAFAELREGDVGLVTAPGGRDRIASALHKRGVRVFRADVYVRVPAPLPSRALERIRTNPQRLLLALSSGEALRQALAVAPEDVRAALARARVLAASERLAAFAREHGFTDIRIARSARPRDLIAAA